MVRAGLAGFAALLATASCGFPDVTYANGPPPADGATTLDARVDTDAATVDERPPSDDATDDVETEAAGSDGPALRDVADEYVFEAATDAPSCDQDLDLWPAQGAVCGGTDCDDHDPHANPGVGKTYLTYMQHAPTNGDWNCDGRVEKQFPVNVTCYGLGLGNACTNTSGFVNDPLCGATDMFVQCQTMGLLCGPGQMSMMVQACR